ncbi:hypothetical protein ACIP9H_04885 [Streptomyces sp. NPDC088732]|uniref:hypothetical protein n=1 Tax=Streptomyces sp. NPDC088732 TaxID=3365879 RepID=UPI0037F26A09
MRWRSALAMAAASVVLASAQATGEPFPVRARLKDGPPAFVAGAAAREFRVELENTTGRARRDVHPVIVLVDRDRKLTARQVRLEYRTSATGGAKGAGRSGGARWRPVPVAHTGNDENIAVVGEHDPGVVLPAHRTVRVALRLRFTPDAPPGPVEASATVVQRRGADGDWVGESAPYRFTVAPPGDGSGAVPPTAPGTPRETAGGPAPGGTGTAPGAGGGHPGAGEHPGVRPGEGPGGHPAERPGAGPGASPGAGGGAGPGTTPGRPGGAVTGKGDEGDPGPRETAGSRLPDTPAASAGPRTRTHPPGLADTGPAQDPRPALLLIGAGALLLAGGVVLRVGRRR